jgi:hypothetical protein
LLAASGQLPTPAAPSNKGLPVVGKVIEPRVNVRSAPSLQGAIISKVQKDDLITLIGQSNDGLWFRAIYQAGTEPAWVFGETLEIAEGDPHGLPIVTSPPR